MSDRRTQMGIRLLRSFGCHEVDHSGHNLLDHLVRTHNILKKWRGSEPMCLAGLFHSIYGTESFGFNLERPKIREEVRQVIGEDSEIMAWLFCVRSSNSFWREIDILADSPMENSRHRLQHRLTGERLSCTGVQLRGIINIEIANAFEQAERMSGYYGEREKKTFEALLPYALPGAAVEFLKLFG